MRLPHSARQQADERSDCERHGTVPQKDGIEQQSMNVMRLMERLARRRWCAGVLERGEAAGVRVVRTRSTPLVLSAVNNSPPAHSSLPEWNRTLPPQAARPAALSDQAWTRRTSLGTYRCEAESALGAKQAGGTRGRLATVQRCPRRLNQPINQVVYTDRVHKNTTTLVPT